MSDYTRKYETLGAIQVGYPESSNYSTHIAYNIRVTKKVQLF
jgi:hypothetical protein